jgi:hypothetical protein
MRGLVIWAWLALSAAAMAQQREIQPPTATEVFNLRTRCAQLAERFSEEMVHGSYIARLESGMVHDRRHSTKLGDDAGWTDTNEYIASDRSGSMVGREDEAHFIMSAGSWTIAGLVLSLVGVVLLFRYGMPYRVRTRGQPIRVAISSDPRAATLERRYDILGWLGLLLIVLGTICQIVGAVFGGT